ncbi:hypothetical protein GA0115255_101181, partial [Streptomyces sp. Ncost-T6T-2b]
MTYVTGRGRGVSADGGRRIAGVFPTPLRYRIMTAPRTALLPR